MSSTVTVSVRSLLVAMGLVLAVVVAYLLGSAGHGGTAQAAAIAPPEKRSITMTGVGVTSGVPDQLSYSFSVGGNGADVSAALDQASEQDVRRDRGAADDRRPEEGHRDDRALDQSDVRLRRPPLGPHRLPRAASPPASSSDPCSDAGKALGRQRRRRRQLGAHLPPRPRASATSRRAARPRHAQQAVTTATAKATQYAEATGQHLGEVLTLSEVKRGTRSDGHLSASYSRCQPRAAQGRRRADPGRFRDPHVEVSVVWELR